MIGAFGADDVALSLNRRKFKKRRFEMIVDTQGVSAAGQDKEWSIRAIIIAEAWRGVKPER